MLHGPGRGMGVTEGVVCRVEVHAEDGAFLGESEAGKLGKEHRLHGTVPGDRVTVAVTARFAGGDECDCGSDGCTPVLEELAGTCDVVLTGDLDDVVRFGLGPAWQQVVAIDTGELAPELDDADGMPLGRRGQAPRSPAPSADASDLVIRRRDVPVSRKGARSSRPTGAEGFDGGSSAQPDGVSMRCSTNQSRAAPEETSNPAPV